MKIMASCGHEIDPPQFGDREMRRRWQAATCFDCQAAAAECPYALHAAGCECAAQIARDADEHGDPRSGVWPRDVVEEG